MKMNYYLLLVLAGATNMLFSQAPAPQPQPEPRKKTSKKEFALISAKKTLHPTLPETQKQLIDALETPAEKKIAENVAKSDFNEKTWLIIKSLQPGQFITNAKGKSGRLYMFKVRRDGSLQIAITK